MPRIGERGRTAHVRATNPLHDGGPEGADFTVGAADRGGKMDNFFTGLPGGLAVYRCAWTRAERLALPVPHADSP